MSFFYGKTRINYYFMLISFYELFLCLIPTLVQFVAALYATIDKQTHQLSGTLTFANPFRRGKMTNNIAVSYQDNVHNMEWWSVP